MKTKHTDVLVRTAVALSLLVNTIMAEQVDAGKPQKKSKGRLKVFILAGQSNMEGHAKVETFDYIGDDPATAPLLKEMRGPDGKPVVCENVWISYLTGSPDKDGMGEGFGKLTAWYGSRHNPTEEGNWRMLGHTGSRSFPLHDRSTEACRSGWWGQGTG